MGCTRERRWAHQILVPLGMTLSRPWSTQSQMNPPCSAPLARNASCAHRIGVKDGDFSDEHDTHTGARQRLEGWYWGGGGVRCARTQ